MLCGSHRMAKDAGPSMGVAGMHTFLEGRVWPAPGHGIMQAERVENLSEGHVLSREQQLGPFVL